MSDSSPESGHDSGIPPGLTAVFRDVPQAARQRALAGLRALYETVEVELRRIAPRCELSGRCCNFPESGMTLFATELELDHLRETRPVAGQAVAELCPWWVERRCTAREGRPLGCRLYFCDETKSAELEAVSIRFHAELKRLHDSCDVPYRYVPFVRSVRGIDGVDQR